ncbi:MAG TPA: Gfo/Idh/MocA family oxidoreductase [Verrucomicrobiae bacterium]|jgi:predicted dehydrogenase|nr:Gfo/Idh/MocA family oxidoreductase [Verrucomicrobiae bacterium]
MNRRKFLQAGAAGLALSTLTNYAADFADQKKRVGLIGCGWYGKIDLLRLIQVAPVEVVSLCDVDSQMLGNAADLVASRQLSKKKPRTYGDYRDMLREKDLDVVLIGTPDHWHALAMIAAVQSGADIYVQKPVSADIVEGQAMLAAARKHGRVVQVGTQRRSTPHLIEARENIIKTGKLGKIGHVELCCYYGKNPNDNPPDIAPPDYLNYEMWTGPAPMRPFNRMIHPRNWRQFMEYGNGTVGDMCVHMLDLARWMLDLGWPKTVSSSGGIIMSKASKANIADTQTATFDYGDLQMVWQHRTWGEAPDPKYPWAAIFYGDKGTLKTSVWSYDFIPHNGGETIHKDVTFELEQYPEDKTEKDLEKHVAPAVRYHMKDLLSCIATRGRPVADIEEGYISSATCILANLSMKLNRTLAWDATTGKILNDDDANQLLRRPYRAPWQHPEVTTV